MDTLFFLLAKSVGLALRVESWLALGLALALLAQLRGRRRFALGATGATLALLLALITLPLGHMLMAPLEGPWPPTPIPDRLDGIVLLGGYESYDETGAWGQPQMNDAADRLFAAAMLVRAHPQARIVLSGGEARLGRNTPPPAVAAPLLTALGIAPDRILWEDRSRNTAENATLTLDLLGGVPQGDWVLVTSAFHMDRALRSFAAAGWPGIRPFPTDYRSSDPGDNLGWASPGRIDLLNTALKEWVGRIGYRVTGR